MTAIIYQFADYAPPPRLVELDKLMVKMIRKLRRCKNPEGRRVAAEMMAKPEWFARLRRIREARQ